MHKTAMLCIDKQSLQHPALIGLSDVNLMAQSWLRVCTDAHEARYELCGNNVFDIVWVISSNSIEGINLAAALQKDNPYAAIYYVAFDITGSVMSRSYAAGLAVLHKEEFVQSFSHYAARGQTSAVPFPQQNTSKFTALNTGSSSLLQQSFQQQCGTHQPAAQFHTASLSVQQPWQIPAAAHVSAAPQTPVAQRAPAGAAKQQSAARPLRSAPEMELDLDEPPHLSVPAVSSDAISIQKEPAVRSLNVPGHEQQGFVITVVSGSGGTGKSTCAALLGMASVATGLKTVVVDADFQFGDMSFLLGLSNQVTVEDVLRQPEKLRDVGSGGSLPSLIAAPEHLEYSEEASKKVGELLSMLKTHFDCIVVNTGSFWHELHAQLIEVSDKTVLVADQRPSSVRACAHTLSLCARCGIATQNFFYVLNRCSRQALLSSVDVSCALKGVSVFELKEGGKEVGELLAAGLPLELIKEKNACYESTKALFQELIPRTMKRGEGERTVLKAPQKRKKQRKPSRRRRVACL